MAQTLPVHMPTTPSVGTSKDVNPNVFLQTRPPSVPEPVVWAQNPAFNNDDLDETSGSLSDHLYSPTVSSENDGDSEDAMVEESQVRLVSLNDAQIVPYLRNSEEKGWKSMQAGSAIHEWHGGVPNPLNINISGPTKRGKLLRLVAVLAAAGGGIAIGVLLGKKAGSKAAGTPGGRPSRPAWASSEGQRATWTGSGMGRSNLHRLCHESK